MTTHNRRKRSAVVVCSVVLIAGCLIGFTAMKHIAKGQQEANPVKIPQLTSIIPNLEIISATVVDPGQDNVGLSFEIRNNSDKAVMAVDVASGLNGLTLNGLHDPDNPQVVIEPHGTVTGHMTFSAMEKDAPLVIAAVTYADGTEEGDERSLDLMHKVRARDKAMRDAEKAKRDAEKKGEPR